MRGGGITLTVIYFAKNKGHGEARREALNNCKYEIVALMDSDDISCGDRFERQLKAFLCESGVDVVGGNIAEFINEPTNVVAYRVVKLSDDEIKNDLKTRCPFNQMTVMLKKSSVEKAGGYLDWYCNEDYFLWLRMYLTGARFKNIDDILVNVRVGKEMYQRRGGLKYYKSEKALQKYMRKNKIIGFGTYLSNVMKRFIVQVLLPNKLRAWVFKKFARKKEKMVKDEKV